MLKVNVSEFLTVTILEVKTSVGSFLIELDYDCYVLTSPAKVKSHTRAIIVKFKN